MNNYLDRLGHKFSLFDVPLVYNFSEASRTPNADLTKIFDGTLAKYKPVNAVVSGSCSDQTQRLSHPFQRDQTSKLGFMLIYPDTGDEP